MNEEAKRAHAQLKADYDRGMDEARGVVEAPVDSEETAPESLTMRELVYGEVQFASPGASVAEVLANQRRNRRILERAGLAATDCDGDNGTDARGKL
jgi:hypothetical protein